MRMFPDTPNIQTLCPGWWPGLGGLEGVTLLEEVDDWTGLKLCPISSSLSLLPVQA